MIDLKNLPFDSEVKEYEVRGNKDGSRAAANRDIGRNAMVLHDDIEDAYVAQFFSDEGEHTNSDPMADVAEWDDFGIDFYS